MKTVIVISIIVLASAGAGFGIYYKNKKDSTDESSTPLADEPKPALKETNTTQNESGLKTNQYGEYGAINDAPDDYFRKPKPKVLPTVSSAPPTNQIVSSRLSGKAKSKAAIDSIIKSILNDEKWFQDVKKKAQGNKISLQDQMRKDAEWMLLNDRATILKYSSSDGYSNADAHISKWDK